MAYEQRVLWRVQLCHFGLTTHHSHCKASRVNLDPFGKEAEFIVSLPFFLVQSFLVLMEGLSRKPTQYRARFVFIGAGGYALPLLQKTKIPDVRGFMGFPISGEFLVCQNPEVVAKHGSKVYGKAAIGAPPMSVPHLDARVIGGKPMLLFGPFAGFSPRFLKTGSLMDSRSDCEDYDLFRALKLHNVVPAAAAGLRNLDLTRYLLGQLLSTKSQKLQELRSFLPEAEAEDWSLVTAGQRVQIMKRDPKKIGVLQFGTEARGWSTGWRRIRFDDFTEVEATIP
eukprot:g11314.t1